MSNKLLLPHKYKKAGWILLVPSIVLGIFVTVTGFEPEWLDARVFSFFPGQLPGKYRVMGLTYANLASTIVGVLFIIGALLTGFSKEKNEDEFISNLRLSSLLWAVLVNYSLLLLAFIFIYGMAFLNVMIYNMFTVLLLFIIRFNYILYKNSKPVPDEK
jgi:hypothetical protein